MQEYLPPHVSTLPIELVFDHLERHHGIVRHVASNRLHQLKAHHGLPANFNLLFHKTGNVYRGDNRMFLGSLTEGGKTKGEG